MCKGGDHERRNESANQARITSAHAPAVSRGIDGQEEEQTAGCLYGNDGLQPQVRDVAPQSCRRGATRTSASTSTPLRARSPTRVVPGLARCNRICAKPLMPFLPTLVVALERH